MIESTDGEPQINLAYKTWRKQDKLILALLRSSLSDSILSQVMSSKTSSELWSRPQQIFSSSSVMRQSELLQQLQNLSKGGSSCGEYLQKIRSIVDELSFIGAPVKEQTLVMHMLNGLGSEYNPLVFAVASRKDPISSVELQSLLLTSEALLLNQQAANTSPSAFYAQHSHSKAGPPQRNNHFNPGFRPRNSSGFRSRQQKPPRSKIPL